LQRPDLRICQLEPLGHLDRFQTPSSPSCNTFNRSRSLALSSIRSGSKPPPAFA
jgi:hypothetical protein